MDRRQETDPLLQSFVVRLDDKGFLLNRSERENTALHR